jgi:hypothetical protein
MQFKIWLQSRRNMFVYIYLMTFICISQSTTHKNDKDTGETMDYIASVTGDLLDRSHNEPFIGLNKAK